MIKVVKIIGLLALLALFLSTGVYGYFTSMASSSDNGMTAGNLYLGKDENNKGILEGSLKLSKMIPGETPREFKLTVRNVGDIKAYVNGLSAAIKETDGKFMSNAIKVTCTGQGGENLFSGSLLALDKNVLPTENEVVIEPGESKILTYTFQLDQRAGNWYKGKNIEIELVVYAGQSAGQKLETNVVTVSKNVNEAIYSAAPNSVILLTAGNYGKITVNKPDLTIKAKDVVFDTALSGVICTGKIEKVSVQGFTVNGQGSQTGILGIDNNSKDVTIKDNIFQNYVSGDSESKITRDIKLGSAAIVDIQRNDFSALVDKNTGDNQTSVSTFKKFSFPTNNSSVIRNNLGLDLDPMVDAL